MPQVQFYFGVGSRYSYLASTQISRLAAETGAKFEWRALNSRELIERAGSDPFRPEVTRGQYDPGYRTRDAKRWAAYYGVPYREPAWGRIDWKLMAFACVTAARFGAGEEFARRLFNTCFDGGDVVDEGTLARIAAEVELNSQQFLNEIQSPETIKQHQRNIDDAARAGAFGVPTFVLDDGELFWGQDRLPLLRQALIK